MRPFLFLLIAMSALPLAGCGGDDDGSSDSSGTSTTTVTAPTITTQPSSASVAAGSSATFSVTASGSSLTYQWYKAGSAISGATSASYAIASVATSDAASYYVTISNSAGSVTSSTVTLTVTTSGGSGSSDCDSATTQGAILTCLANSFVATLSSSEQTAVAYDLTSANATNYWSNLPTALVQRHGLALSELSSTSKAAAETLLNAALTTQGQQTMAGLRAADEYLAQYRASDYGADLYYISFLGTPSTSDPWILEFTGHHYTFFASVDGDVISLTPNFVGVEPVTWTSNGTTYTPMALQHDALLAMLNGLSSTELAAAKLSQAYDDLLVGPQKDGNFPSTPSGLLVSSLTSDQQALVKAAIASYAGDANGTGQADAYTTDSALASTYISWASYSDLATRGSYVRIDGPSVWIEFSVQSGVVLSANHYHTIWRDKSLDYGGNFQF